MPEPPAAAGPFADLAAYVALPRVTALAAHAPTGRVVVAVQQPDPAGARYVSSLWEVPAAGGEAVRLTRSGQGEGSPAFLPDGRLLFTSTRPVPDGDRDRPDDEAALWVLPARGEPSVTASRAGGLSTPVVAADSGAVLLTGSRLARSTDGRRPGAPARARGAEALDGPARRHADPALGPRARRGDGPLLLLAAEGGELVDLAPDADRELEGCSCSITADGATVATTWRMRGARGGCVRRWR